MSFVKVLNENPDVELIRDTFGYSKITHQSVINQREDILEGFISSIIDLSYKQNHYTNLGKLYYSDCFHHVIDSEFNKEFVFITEVKKILRKRNNDPLVQCVGYYIDSFLDKYSNFDKIKFLIVISGIELYLYEVPTKEELDLIVPEFRNAKYYYKSNSRMIKYSGYNDIVCEIMNKHLLKHFVDEDYIYSAQVTMCKIMDLCK